MYITEADVLRTNLGGKPSPGTRKDRRLRRNRKRKARSKTPAPMKALGYGHALQGTKRGPVEWIHGG